MKKRTTKKALVLSFLAMLLCCAMLVGTTYAWFTDSAATGANRIVAGNLDIELNVKVDGEFTDATALADDALFQVDLWEPGVVAYETFEAANVGTLALKYNMYVGFSGMNYVEGTTYSLADVIKVAVIEGELGADTTREGLIAAVQGNLVSVSDAAKVAEGVLGPVDAGNDDSNAIYTVVAYWEPSNNDNNYNLNNGKESTDGEPLSIGIAITLSATQVPYETEKDSFDENYDDGIELSGVVAMTSAINQGAKDSNSAIAEAIKAIAEELGLDLTDEELSQLVYFDDALEENADGELAITLHFEPNTINYVDATYTAVKSLIGTAVQAQAGNIYSIQIEDMPVHVLNGSASAVDAEGDWVEADLRAIVRAIGASGGLSAALEAAKANGLAVEIIDMDGNAQVYRMNFDLKDGWNEF